MKTGKAGIALIKKYEGLYCKSYKCPAGVWTVGYGHTKTAKEGMIITEAEAERLLISDLSDSERTINGTLLRLTQNQFDALVSFVFNVGSGNFLSSTLYKRIKEKASNDEIRRNFMRWVYANKKYLAGLEKRRREEADLFFDC